MNENHGSVQTFVVKTSFEFFAKTAKEPIEIQTLGLQYDNH